MRTLLPTLLSLTLLGCSRESPHEPESEILRVESPDLGIAIGALPDGFTVVSNRPDKLEMARDEGLPPGTAWLEVGPLETSGVNLVEIVKGQRASFEALSGGSFGGNRELMMSDGRPGYYSRGRFLENGVEVEEFRIHSLHPGQNRVLRAVYRYPAGEDSADRLNDILVIAGEIEGLPDAPTADAGSESP